MKDADIGGNNSEDDEDAQAKKQEEFENQLAQPLKKKVVDNENE